MDRDDWERIDSKLMSWSSLIAAGQWGMLADDERDSPSLECLAGAVRFADIMRNDSFIKPVIIKLATRGAIYFEFESGLGKIEAIVNGTGQLRVPVVIHLWLRSPDD